jgi:hypothetical protein
MAYGINGMKAYVGNVWRKLASLNNRQWPSAKWLKSS